MQKLLFLICLLISSFVLSNPLLGETRKPSSIQGKRVLLLYSYHPTFITSENLLAGVQSVLAPHNLALDIEFMDSKRQSDERYMNQLFALLKEKMARRDPYDVVIVSDDNALNFAVRCQKDIFKEIPIVFMAVNNVDNALKMDDNPYITGVIEAITPEQTINLTRKLHPELKSITVIADDTPSGKADVATIEKLYPQFPDLLFNLLSLGDYSWEEVADQLKQQRPNSVLIGLAAFRDKNGLVLSYKDSISLLISNSPVPVYVLREHGVRNGALGGNVVSFYEQGRRAALMAEQILKGTPVKNIRVLRDSPNQYMFDYPSLERFAIDKSLLPADSVILHKPVTIFEQYGQYAWTALGAIFLLLLFVIFLLYEIGARRKVEAALKIHQDHLEERVKARTAELEAANKDLESFSYSVSHDLRAPLRGIDGYSQILVSDYADTLDEEGKNYLNRIRDGAQRMAGLIDDILELSRVTRRKLESEPLNLSKMAADVTERLKKINNNRNVDIHIEANLTANGDRHLVEVALENLLDNAWKYTSKTQHAHIEFGKQNGSSEPVYYVSDNGAGFNMQYVNKLFRAFQRLHGVDEFPGTGIGLASVYRVIDRHGGRIWAEAEEGKGATFYFTLPH
ncbi:ABC transporter substrate binding protein [Kaarinaea lacus]